MEMGLKKHFEKSIQIVDQKIRSGYYNLSDSSKHGNKKIISENNGERIIDKKSLIMGKKQKSDDLCCG